MRLKIISLILLLFQISCEKNETTSKVPSLKVPDELVGFWSWDYSSGGIGGWYKTPKSTGENKKIYFDYDNNFLYFVNNVLKSESKFTLEKEKSITGNDSALIIKNIPGFPQSISFRSLDTLILFEECYDCYEHHYTRIK